MIKAVSYISYAQYCDIVLKGRFLVAKITMENCVVAIALNLEVIIITVQSLPLKLHTRKENDNSIIKQTTVCTILR